MGERCSGTNFLEHIIRSVFRIKTAWNLHGYQYGNSWNFLGHKHFFGFMPIKKIQKYSNTLFLGIVRDPYEWMMSVRKHPHHFHHLRRSHIKNYEFYYHTMSSFHHIYGEIFCDRNFKTNINPELANKYKDIFELRKTKLEYLIETMPTIASNYVIIRYEDLVNNHEKELDNLINKFGLNPINEFPNIVKPKPYNIHDIEYLNNHIDWGMENKIGYSQRKK